MMGWIIALYILGMGFCVYLFRAGKKWPLLRAVVSALMIIITIPFLSYLISPTSAAGSTNETTTGSTNETKQVHTPYYTLHTTELLAAYESNEIAADKVFKGATIELAGFVRKVSRDRDGNPYVLIGGNQYDYHEVSCFFLDDNEVMGLRKNNLVKIKGTCIGIYSNVTLLECTLAN